jgi:phosphoribosyl 1,2-cyclic phosphodiesterase
MLRLRVLASGSGGNCSLLTVGAGHRTRAVLIDAGLSPRRTRRMLVESGVRPDQVVAILITHFDRDHFHPGWANADLAHTRVWCHEQHDPPSLFPGRDRPVLRTFSGCFEPAGPVRATPVRLAHDAEGVTAFRLDTDDSALGFATDLGRVTPELLSVFGGVGALAIESNYCPRMQLESARPEFLKARIMSGRGHLSNDEAALAARAIGAGTVVLLHLSRQCNTPELARAGHRGRVIVSSQHEPTEWLTVEPARAMSAAEMIA